MDVVERSRGAAIQSLVRDPQFLAIVAQRETADVMGGKAADRIHFPAADVQDRQAPAERVGDHQLCFGHLKLFPRGKWERDRSRYTRRNSFQVHFGNLSRP